jgi:hypothetical protein
MLRSGKRDTYPVADFEETDLVFGVRADERKHNYIVLFTLIVVDTCNSDRLHFIFE